MLQTDTERRARATFTNLAREKPIKPLRYKKKWTTTHETVGWTDCGCNAGFDSDMVLDPMCRAGTTLVAARKLCRNYIGIELNPEYVKMARRRLAKIPARLDNF